MNNKIDKEEQKIEAGKNTAHLAGRTASRYFGGELGGKVYDTLAQTKLGQNLERRVGKNIAKTPVVGNVNKKLNDSGAVNAANQAVDTLGGKTKSGTRPNQALQKNKSNQKRNLSSFLNKRKKNSVDNDNQNNEESNPTGNNLETEEESKEKVSIKKRIKQIKLAIMIIGPVLFFLFIILISVVVVGYIGSLFGVVSLSNGEVTSMTDMENEEKYYKKLDEVIAKYQRKYNVTIDKNFIHTILIYPINNYFDYFEGDFDLEDVDAVDYDSLTGQIETVAKFFVSHCKTDETCSIDYEIDGSSYNKIKDSSFFKKHYKEILKKADADTILEDVFNLAEVGSSFNEKDVFIADDLKVKISDSNKTVSFPDYIMGVSYNTIKGNNMISTTNKEFLKAQVIATTSSTLAKVGYQSGATEITVKNGDINEGYYNVNSIPSSDKKILQDVFNSVFGTIMVNTDGSIKEAKYSSSSCGTDCMGYKNAVSDAKKGMTYNDILGKYYDNYTIIDAKEDSYASNVSYGDGGYTENVVYYNQNDYNNKFCGRSNATIATSGCGTTAMAMVLSTLVDEKYDPVSVMKEAYSFGSCGSGISGTSTSFFKKSAAEHDLEYKRVSKSGDLQAVLDALASGNSLVVAHMGPGTFTRSGHYIVLARVNEKGQVYVYDSNKASRNGWYKFNSVVVKELRGSFHIITKG